MEHRAGIKFCVKCGKSASETFGVLKTAYICDCVYKSTVYERCKQFSDCRDSLEDDPRIGRPRTSSDDKNVQSVRDLLATDRRLTSRMIAEELKISNGQTTQ